MFNIDVVPSNLNQALEILDTLEEEDKRNLKEEGHIGVHFSLGWYLRKYWSLWEKDTPLVLWFKEKEISHADDMSSIILEAYACKLRGTEYDINSHISSIKKHWKSFGLESNSF